jgi:subtilisin family serine protease
MQGTGDVGDPGDVAFIDGVREGTINLPATHPAIIGVGCTISKTSWQSLSGVRIGLQAPVLDRAGGEPSLQGESRDAVDGEPCWFSSAGPTLTGVFKPEIMAPGAAIVGALSQQAIPTVVPNESIFAPDCFSVADAGLTCQQIDRTHAVSKGTSFSAPIVAGAVALLLERDPTLTQNDVLAALQAGAHPLRSAAPFNDQAGAGELDVVGALTAVDRLHDPQLALPTRSESWIALGSDLYLADGSTPLVAIVELRATRQGTSPAPPADGFAGDRLAVYALADGVSYPLPPAQRVGPGVWTATVQLPAGLGGRRLTVGATFDGVDVVDPKSVPVATDPWNAAYAPTASGGCTACGPCGGNRHTLLVGLGVMLAALRARGSQRSSARAKRTLSTRPTSAAIHPSA